MTRTRIAAALALVLALAALVVQATMLNSLLMLARWFTLSLIPLAVGGVGAVAAHSFRPRARWHGLAKVEHGSRSKHVAGVAVCVAAGLGFVGAVAVGGYASSRQVAASVTEESDIPAYDRRAPLVSARAQSVGHMDSNGTAGDTTYIADRDRFGTAVAGRGWTDGYTEVVWQKVGENGQSTADNCRFDKAVPRFGGFLGANLRRAIIREAGFGTMVDPSDSYAFCTDSGDAVFVAPLTQLDGLLFPYATPAGVAVADGRTGEVTVRRDVAAGELPGPVYPVSLAERARSATRASGSWWDYVMHRVGYQVPDDNDNDNAGNSGEFTLARTDGRIEFVTPLRLRGNSRAITAVGAVAADEVHAGRLNPYQVRRLAEPRQSNSATVDRLRADYGSLPEWAAGMNVFELVPAGSGEWVATLGMKQAVRYRAVVAADGSSCLFDTAGQKVRCSGTAPDTGQAGASADVAALSDAELAELLRSAAQESARRMTSP